LNRKTGRREAVDSLTTSGGHRSAPSPSATRRPARRLPFGTRSDRSQAAGVVTDAGVSVAITSTPCFPTATPLFHRLRTLGLRRRGHGCSRRRRSPVQVEAAIPPSRSRAARVLRRACIDGGTHCFQLCDSVLPPWEGRATPEARLPSFEGRGAPRWKQRCFQSGAALPSSSDVLASMEGNTASSCVTACFRGGKAA
jgi:hypothetical protein